MSEFEKASLAIKQLGEKISAHENKLKAALRGALPIVEDAAGNAAFKSRQLPINDAFHDKWAGVAFTLGRQSKEIRELLGMDEL